MILESDLCKIFILGWLFLKYEYVVFLPYLWVFLGNFGATTTMPLPTTKAKRTHPLLFTGKTGVPVSRDKTSIRDSWHSSIVSKSSGCSHGTVRFRGKYFFHF